MRCTIAELTDEEYERLRTAGLTDLQIAYCSFKRWTLRMHGLGHNLLATPDTLRNRIIQP